MPFQPVHHGRTTTPHSAPARPHRLRRRIGIFAAVNLCALSLAAGVAHAEASGSLPPPDAATQAALLHDSIDATQGVTDPRLLTVLAVARAQLGKPYVFGTDGPASFDCSGLVHYAYAAAGYHVGDWTGAQISAGTAVKNVAEIQPGDLVFTPGAHGTMEQPGHVALYVGDGLLIQAPGTGSDVQLIHLSSWKGKIAAIRRVIHTVPPAPLAAPTPVPDPASAPPTAEPSNPATTN